MSRDTTYYPATKDNAVLLLAAADELGIPRHVIRTTRQGFTAPDEVLAKAFGEKKQARRSSSRKASEKSDAKSEE